MKRKLFLASALLLAASAVIAMRVRQDWLDAQAREQAILRARVKPAPVPPIAKTPPEPPVKPAAYIDIAQKMLFSRDRNPTVIVDAPPPPKPKPMPPLPVFHGMLDLGDGPTAILSVKPGAEHRDFRPGDEVGEFKLVAVNNDEIVLEWDGKTITKNVRELFQKEPAPSPTTGRVASAAAPTAAAPTVAPGSAPAAPGTDLGDRGIKACQAGDSSPAGTVTDGFRKVVKASPFGKSCFWEPAK
ncbi:MAG: hypothetical protein U0Q18_18975 [Bryobacteraceae bacterium]